MQRKELEQRCKGENKVKIKVKHAFKDAENDRKLRTPGEIMDVPEKRAAYLVSMNAAEYAEESSETQE